MLNQDVEDSEKRSVWRRRRRKIVREKCSIGEVSGQKEEEENEEEKEEKKEGRTEKTENE